MKRPRYPLHVHYKMRPGRLRVLKTLSDWEGVRGIWPSLAVLAEILDCSRQCVHQHLQRLVADGLVEKEGYGRYVTTNKGRKYIYSLQK